MVVKDPIYGKFTIENEVILELLKDPKVLRLKKITQGGTIDILKTHKDFSRYDHSLGCMLLIRHLGGSLDEQIAALLHDISHTAFSHVGDVVYKKNENKESYHEIIKKDYINKSNIPNILKKYNFNIDYIGNEKNFALLEKPLPNLCADRIDYSLRSLYVYLNKQNKAKEYFNHLIKYNSEIIFDNKNIAIEYSRDFLNLDKKIYNNIVNRTSYYILADIIKRSLKLSIIKESDLLTYDQYVLDKIKKTTDPEIILLLNKLNRNLKPKKVSPTQASLKNYKYKIQTKVRVVNAKFLDNGKIKHVLDHNTKLKEDIRIHNNKYEKLMYVNID
ncbi:MAG: HD domain-containing protein [Patescibacteria group bacterium]